jgi:hypothetical protein
MKFSLTSFLSTTMPILNTAPITCCHSNYLRGLITSFFLGFLSLSASLQAASPVLSEPRFPAATVGTPFSYQMLASDADGDTLFFTASSGMPSWLSLNSATGLLSGIPTQIASQTYFTVTVSDNVSASSKSVYVTVLDASMLEVVASDGTSNNAFGGVLSFSGNLAVIGDYSDDAKGVNSGSAYIFANTSGNIWVQQAKLMASDGTSYDVFGSSVAISGQTVAIGATGDDDMGSESGSVYVYANTSGNIWVEQIKISANDGASQDSFGGALALSGNVLLVGAYGDDDKGSRSGSAYIFANSSGNIWTQQTKLLASDGSSSDLFGSSLALEGHTAVVGAYYDDSASGSAYIFKNISGNVWTQQTKIFAADGASYDNFAQSLAISGNTIVIGSASNSNKSGVDAGAVYVFANTSDNVWVQQEKIIAGNDKANDIFGNKVAIAGNILTVLSNTRFYVYTKATGSSFWVLSKYMDTFNNSSNIGGVSLYGATALIGFYTAHNARFVNIHQIPNVAPTLLSRSTLLATPGSIFTYNTRTFDGNSDVLTYSSNQLPSWMSLSATIGVLSGTPPVGSVAESFVLQVSDGSSSTNTTLNLGYLDDSMVKVLADDGLYDDQFGTSVAISGNIAVVGAPGDDDLGSGSGSAYVYEKTTDHHWRLQARLLASDGSAGDSFGSSLSISGNVIAVGAKLDDDKGSSAGSVYIFAQSSTNTWTQQTKLLASDGVGGDEFGVSVSVSGNVIAVGAKKDDVSSIYDRGSTYVFANTSANVWVQQTKIEPHDGVAYDYFGGSVSLSSNVLVVGAHGKDGRYFDSGAAYIYANSAGNTWEYQTKIVSEGTVNGVGFGYSVSMSGNMLVVGAVSDDSLAAQAGSAFVYTNSSGNIWTQQAKLLASDGETSDNFGSSVSISGNIVVVGSPGDDQYYKVYGHSDLGSTYMFASMPNGVWRQIGKSVLLDAGSGDKYGSSVAVFGQTALVGAPFEDDNGTSAGSAYFVNTTQLPNVVPFLSGPSTFNPTIGTPFSVTLQGVDGNSDPMTYSSNYLPSGFSLNGSTGVLSGTLLTGLGTKESFIVQVSDGLNSSNTILSMTVLDDSMVKVLAPDGKLQDYFGGSVALSGNLAVVGAYGDDDNGTNSGSAYVFEKTSDNVWIQQAKLLAGDGYAGDDFGYAVAISGNVIVVGARGDNDKGSSSGSAYVFANTSGNVWMQQAKLWADDGDTGDYFGNAVSISGNVIVVGASNDDNGNWNSYSGSAYVFANVSANVWTQQVKVLASDGEAGDYFGCSVSISGNVLTIGAYGENDKGSSAGSVYVFANSSANVWAEQAKLLASDGSANDKFGESVSLSGNVLVVGAAYDDKSVNILDSGSAYVFANTSGNQWIQQAKLLASDELSHDRFGGAVAISDNVIAVGAVNAGSAYRSSVYFFVAQPSGIWQQSGQSSLFDLSYYGDFGSAVALSGSMAAVGYMHDDDNGSSSGSAYFVNVANLPNISPRLVSDRNSLHVTQGEVFSYVAQGFDGNGDALTYSSNNLPSWLSLNTVTGQLSGTPTAEYGTTNSFVLNVSDGVSSSNTTFNLTTLHESMIKVLARDGKTSDNFGQSVAISGNLAVVGAKGEDENGSEVGAVYVYEKTFGNVWIQQAKILPSDGKSGNDFGNAVAISDNVIVVGAQNVYDNGYSSGSAYVFVNSSGNTWTQQTKLRASDVSAYDNFGYSVSISGNVIVVGASDDDDKGTDSGSAYVFVNRSGNIWTQQTKLLASDGSSYDHFGWSVSISGNIAVIGAYAHDDNGIDSGSAYVFANGSGNIWAQQTKLVAIDGSSYEYFGYSVSVSDNNLAVGAYQDNSSGSVYIYANTSGNSWTLQSKLLPHDGDSNSQFGTSVAILGNRLAVGARTHVANNVSSGAAYFYKANTNGIWQQTGQSIPQDGSLGDYFGYSVAISEATAVVGAIYDDDLGANSGSAYFIDTTRLPNIAPVLTATRTSLTGSVGQAFSYYVPGFDANSQALTYSATGLPAGISINGTTGELSGSPQAIQSGEFLLQVSDGQASANITVDFAVLHESIVKVLAGDGAINDYLGYSVSISGDLALVGAYNDNGSGSAYIFAKSSGNLWAEQAKLSANDGSSGDSFGYSVSLSGNLALVGASGDDDNGSGSGSAYIFANTSGNIWGHQAKLLASDGSSGDGFGHSVSMSGNRAIVGAYGDDDNGSDSGSAYIFTNISENVWVQQFKLLAGDGSSDDNFGESVSLSDNLALVGAYGDDDNGSESGSAYIFANTSGNVWIQQSKLLAIDGSFGDHFSHSALSLSGNLAIVGSHFDNDKGGSSGSAYIFANTSGNLWIEQVKLLAEDGSSDDNFGKSVSLSGNLAMVGSWGDSENGLYSGSAYIFSNISGNIWIQQSKILPKDGVSNAQFGFSVSISDNVAIVGAKFDDDNGSSSGSAYLIDLTKINNISATLNSRPSLTGTPSTTATVGTAYRFIPIGYDVDNDPLTFSATGLPSWLSVNTTTGALTGIPIQTAVAVSIMLSVSDGNTSTSLPAFNLRVVKSESIETTIATIVSSDGSDTEILTSTITTTGELDADDPSSFSQMNATKDVIVSYYPEIDPGAQELFIDVKQASSYSQSDLAGTWQIYVRDTPVKGSSNLSELSDFVGIVEFDAVGSSKLIQIRGNQSNLREAPQESWTLSDSGEISIDGNVVNYYMNASKDVIVGLDANNSSYSLNFMVKRAGTGNDGSVPVHSLTGTSWILGQPGISDIDVLVFIDDQNYVVMHNNNTEISSEYGNQAIAASAEFGRYTWNGSTGDFIVNELLSQSDGEGGLFYADLRTQSMVISANTLNYNNGEATFVRYGESVSEDKLSGRTWITGTGSDMWVWSFISDSYYIGASSNNTEPSPVYNGLIIAAAAEFGTYSISANATYSTGHDLLTTSISQSDGGTNGFPEKDLVFYEMANTYIFAPTGDPITIFTSVQPQMASLESLQSKLDGNRIGFGSDLFENGAYSGLYTLDDIGVSGNTYGYSRLLTSHDNVDLMANTSIAVDWSAQYKLGLDDVSYYWPSATGSTEFSYYSDNLSSFSAIKLKIAENYSKEDLVGTWYSIGLKLPKFGTSDPEDFGYDIDQLIYSLPIVNTPPILTGTPTTTATVGTAYSFTPTANDDNNDPLTFSATGLPSWLSLNSTTGALTGTPTTAGPTDSITISVSDGTASSSLESFVITVNGTDSSSATPALTSLTGSATFSASFGTTTPDGLESVADVTISAGASAGQVVISSADFGPWNGSIVGLVIYAQGTDNFGEPTNIVLCFTDTTLSKAVAMTHWRNASDSERGLDLSRLNKISGTLTLKIPEGTTKVTGSDTITNDWKDIFTGSTGTDSDPISGDGSSLVNWDGATASFYGRTFTYAEQDSDGSFALYTGMFISEQLSIYSATEVSYDPNSRKISVELIDGSATGTLSIDHSPAYAYAGTSLGLNLNFEEYTSSLTGDGGGVFSLSGFAGETGKIGLGEFVSDIHFLGPVAYYAGTTTSGESWFGVMQFNGVSLSSYQGFEVGDPGDGSIYGQVTYGAKASGDLRVSLDAVDPVTPATPLSGKVQMSMTLGSLARPIIEGGTKPYTLSIPSSSTYLSLVTHSSPIAGFNQSLRGIGLGSELVTVSDSSGQTHDVTVNVLAATSAIVHYETKALFSATDYYMVSFPFNLPNQTGAELFELIKSKLGLTYNQDYILYAYKEPTGYVQLSSASTPVGAGYGYWMGALSSGNYLFSGNVSSLQSDVSIGLNAGWNLIGNPFGVDMAASSIVYYKNGLEVAVKTPSQSDMGHHFWYYLDTGYVSEEILYANESYWLYSKIDTQLIFKAPGRTVSKVSLFKAGAERAKGTPLSEVDMSNEPSPPSLPQLKATSATGSPSSGGGGGGGCLLGGGLQ